MSAVVFGLIGLAVAVFVAYSIGHDRGRAAERARIAEEHHHEFSGWGDVVSVPNDYGNVIPAQRRTCATCGLTEQRRVAA